MFRISMMLPITLCVGALAVDVPLRSYEDYRYSRPNLISNIVGKVIGDPPDYHIPRSEDVAWLREAWAERVAIAGGEPFGDSWTGNLPVAVMEVTDTGIWPMSNTNRFSRWETGIFQINGKVVTNIIAGTYVVTNEGGGVDSPYIEKVDPKCNLQVDLVANTNQNEKGYLSLSNDLYVSEAKAWRFFTGDDVNEPLIVTNIYDRTVWFDVWTNATSFVTMHMTNGTTSVYTNSWRVYAPTSAVERTEIISTNLHHTIADIFLDGSIHGLNRPLPPPLGGILATAGITNHYATLSQAIRLARWGSCTNRPCPEYYGGYSKPDDLYEVFPGDSPPLDTPYIEVDCVADENDGYEPDYGLRDPTIDPPESWEHFHESFDHTVFFYADATEDCIFAVKMPAFEPTPDGRLPFKSARAYAFAYLYFTEHSRSSGGHSEAPWVEYDTNIVYDAVVRLDTKDLQIATNEHREVLFQFRVTKSELYKAWSAANFPVQLPEFPLKYIPSLRFPVPAGSHDEWVSYTGVSHTRYTFKVHFDPAFVFLIDLAPRTSLPSWNE